MREIPNYTLYLQHSKSQLLLTLANIEREICILQQEIGLIGSEKIKGKVRAYQECHRASASARQQEAEIAVATIAATEVELQADLSTLLEEKFFILRLLDA